MPKKFKIDKTKSYRPSTRKAKRNTPKVILCLSIIIFFICLSFVNQNLDTHTISKSTPQHTPVKPKNLLKNQETLWWKSAIFYQVFVRSFQDSNGDGIGDFRGLISRLDYIKSMGYDALWLMPITESSDKMHGYAVKNYKAVESDYGTMEDFQKLLKEAHKRDIKIIIDWVVNHSSNKHPYFLDAIHNHSSPYRDYYTWSQVRHKNMKLLGDDRSVWHKHKKDSDEYYYGVFSGNMPDLNFKNPDVKQEMLNNLKYWLDMGVDGFRFDAVIYLVENGAGQQKNQPETFSYYREIRKLLDQYQDKFMVCEATGKERFQYLGNGHDMFHACFNFGFQRFLQELNESKNHQLYKQLKLMEEQDYAQAGLGTFLSNHDSFAGDRPATQLGGNLDQLKLAASVLLLSPGIPFIYYGEEIGMQNNLSYKYKHDYQLRTPMQWSSDTHADFSDSSPQLRPDKSYKKINVNQQINNEQSLLEHYRQLIKLRKECPALSHGKSRILSPKNHKSYLILERFTDDVKRFVIFNFGTKAKKIKIEGLLEEVHVKGRFFVII